MFNRNTLLAACAALILSACGGGGGSDGAPSEIPDPTPPVDPGTPEPVPEPEPEPKPEPIRFNDTGITICTEGVNGETEVDCAGTSVPRQDAHYGRDAEAAAGTLEKVGAGGKGFDFTKIANDGTELPATAALGSNPKDWACTRDNVTGLTWEVKVNDAAHLRHFDHTYTWQDDAFPGVVADGTYGIACQNPDGLSCTTKNYAASVNAAGLCGATDWRMPSTSELLGITDLSRSLSKFDPDYFPNMPLGDDYTMACPDCYGGRDILSSQVKATTGYHPYALTSSGGVYHETLTMPATILLVRDSGTDLIP